MARRARRARLVAGAAAVVSIVGLLLAVTPAGALTRSTVDRPDQLVGPQFHVIYAVPLDGVDRGFDTDGSLANSIASFEAWLAGKTGGRELRIDKADGELDISFLALPDTDAAIRAHDPDIRGYLEQQAQTAGFNAPDKIYLVYYDGTSDHSCGGAPWPPALLGSVTAIYLRGFPGTAIECDLNGFAGPGGAPAYLEYAALHESLHALGFVPTCAAHEYRAGHVSDDPDDLMWAGDTNWMPDGFAAAALDANHDDYFETSDPACLDLADSEWLANVQSPPDCSAVVSNHPLLVVSNQHHLRTIRLRGATDPDADPLSWSIDSVTQDEAVTGPGDLTSPDARLIDGHPAWVRVRAELDTDGNGRVYRISYTVSDGAATCAGTTLVGVVAAKGQVALDDGDSNSWNSFTGASLP